MSKFHILLGLGILGSAVMFSACSPEEYGPCSIPNTVGHQVACSPIGDSKTATCKADYVFDCDSRICGIYESSEPFCTHRCKPSASECTSKYCDCPEGVSCKDKCPENAACVEWIKGTSEYYCLPAEYQVSTPVKPETKPESKPEGDSTSTEGTQGSTDDSSSTETPAETPAE